MENENKWIETIPNGISDKDAILLQQALENVRAVESWMYYKESARFYLEKAGKDQYLALASASLDALLSDDDESGFDLFEAVDNYLASCNLSLDEDEIMEHGTGDAAERAALLKEIKAKHEIERKLKESGDAARFGHLKKLNSALCDEGSNESAESKHTMDNGNIHKDILDCLTSGERKEAILFAENAAFNAGLDNFEETSTDEGDDAFNAGLDFFEDSKELFADAMIEAALKIIQDRAE